MGFVHGRLGALLLKRLMEHAYGNTPDVDDDVAFALGLMLDRLKNAGPKKVGKQSVLEWFVFTDAAYEAETETGGLGAVIVNSDGSCKCWFGMQLTSDQCEIFGSKNKRTIIYELELLAACLAIELLKDFLVDSFPVLLVDNDSVRQAMIPGIASGLVAKTVLQRHLRFEVNHTTSIWFARVPSEANIADWPSRNAEHPFFSTNQIGQAEQKIYWLNFEGCQSGETSRNEDGVKSPHVEKRMRQ